MKENNFLNGEKTAEMYVEVPRYIECVRDRERGLRANIKAVAQAMQSVALPFLGGIEDGLPQSLSKAIINEVKTQEKRETAAIAAEENNTLVSLFYHLLPQHTSYEKQGYNYEVQEEKDEDTTGNLGRSDKEDYRYRGSGQGRGGIQVHVLPQCHFSGMARGGGGDSGVAGQRTAKRATARAGSTERDDLIGSNSPVHIRPKLPTIQWNCKRFNNNSNTAAL